MATLQTALMLVLSVHTRLSVPHWRRLHWRRLQAPPLSFSVVRIGIGPQTALPASDWLLERPAAGLLLRSQRAAYARMSQQIFAQRRLAAENHPSASGPVLLLPALPS